MAVPQARALTAVIEGELTGREKRPFRFKVLGEMVPLSWRRAVADLLGIKLVGFPAWLGWKVVYMLKLPTLAARLRVVLDWIVELFFERDVSELIRFEATRTQNSVAYRQVRKALAMIQDTNHIETPIYTLTGFDPAHQEAHFMVTSRGPGLPGETYHLAPELLAPRGQAFHHDQAGTWITSFAPIRDSQGGSLQCWM